MTLLAERLESCATRGETTYIQRLEEIVRKFPDRVAFELKTPEGYRKVSYAQVHAQINAVATSLIALGVKPGDRVAILSENRPEWVVAYLAVILAGATTVPLDPQISPSEWRRLLADCEARFVFASSLYEAKLDSAIQDSSLRKHIICFDPPQSSKGAGRCLKDLEVWAKSLDPAPGVSGSRLSDVVAIIYTSGTTDKPKGVMLTQKNIICEVTAVLEAVHADESDSFLCLLPLQHVLASVINVLVPLYIGARVVFVDTLKRSEVLEALEKAGITILATVPQFFYLFHSRIVEELGKKPALVRALFHLMLAFNRCSLLSLRLNFGRSLFGRIHHSFGRKLRLFVSGGSSFDPRVARFFHDLGFTILQGYGLTETAGACTVTRVEKNVLGSVGQALPSVEVKIVEPDGSGIGEVAIRGPIVMEGYFKNPEATAEVMRQGWFLSGDLGYLDREGNLFITGRIKEVIVLPNGKNIYPDELETHYLQCPYIQEIAVLGIATPGSYEKAERLHAVVVPNFEYLKAKKIANAREILRDEIGRWSNPLPKHKRLMSYQIQKELLPRTSTRKIRRLELKQLIEGGKLQEDESTAEMQAATPEDLAFKESPVGQEVLRCLQGTYHRKSPIDLSMNLELDLGFDSMERVELLASLEQALHLKLPDDFGAEIYNVRDLIMRLQEQALTPAATAAIPRQGWKEILSHASIEEKGERRVDFAGPFLTIFKYLGLRSVYLLCRTLLRLEVRGLENLPKEGPYLLCPNHLSYIDPLVVMCVLPYGLFRKVFFVGASEYFVTWTMKLIARLACIVPVDPDTHLLRAMKIGAYGLRNDRILCIFPEGARSFDGEMKEFKKGAAILSRELGVPIVPVGIQGTYEVWARDSWRIRLHKVKVAFGTPMIATGEGATPYQDDTVRLQKAVFRLLE